MSDKPIVVVQTSDPVSNKKPKESKDRKDFKDSKTIKVLSFLANMSDTIFRLFISLLALLFASLYTPSFIKPEIWMDILVTGVALFNLPLIVQLVQTIFSISDEEVKKLEDEHQKTADSMTVEAFNNMPQYIEEQYELRQDKKYSDIYIKLQGRSRLPFIGKRYENKLKEHNKKKASDMSIIWILGRPHLKKIMSKNSSGILVSSSASYDKLRSDWRITQLLKGSISIIFSIWFSVYIFKRIPIGEIIPTLALASVGLFSAAFILGMRFLSTLKTKSHYKADLKGKILVMKRLNR